MGEVTLWGLQGLLETKGLQGLLEPKGLQGLLEIKDTHAPAVVLARALL